VVVEPNRLREFARRVNPIPARSRIRLIEGRPPLANDDRRCQGFSINQRPERSDAPPQRE